MTDVPSAPAVGLSLRYRLGLLVLALFLCAGFLLLNRGGHVDDGDAQVYQVVERRMAQDHSWLHLRYLPAVFPQFREHLPFGFWPAATAIQIWGESSLVPLSIAWALATLALIGWLGAALGGWETGLTAMLILGTTASFFEPGSRPRLDGPLLFFATAATAPVLLGRLRLSGWLLATSFSAIAAMIKGPFGILPLASAVAARAFVDRSPRTLITGAFCLLAASAPVGGFLLFNHLSGDDTWWVGYLQNQLQASATGLRTDGIQAWWFPLRSLAGRFWPGLPLVVFSAFCAFRPDRSRTNVVGRDDTGTARLLAVHCLLIIIGLCIPTRKVWNHALVVYPFLSLLAAVGTRRFISQSARASPAIPLGTLLAATTAVWVSALSGFGARLLPEPCIVSEELAADLANVPPDAPILIISPTPDWRLIAALASERRLNSVPSSNWASAEPSDPAIAWALARGDLGTEPPQTWKQVRTARGWTLLARGRERQ